MLRLRRNKRVARWLKAQDKTTQRIENNFVSGRGDAGLPYLSCRDCAEGRTGAQAASNDDGGRR